MSPVETAAPHAAKLTAEVLRSRDLKDLALRVVAGESGFARPVS